MPGRIAARWAEGLAALERDGLRRTRRTLDSAQGARVIVGGATLVNFAGNDYLGLAAHPALRAAMHRAIDVYGAGAGASPLVVGYQRPHEEAERRFAAFVGLPRALLFGSGYAANLGILTALCDRHAEIFADRLNHACLNDGALLSRATFTRHAHGDLDALEERLAASTAAVKVIATDAVFSMDGDVADVARLVALCERHDAWLVLDDAHGIGVLGPGGRGTLAESGVRSPRVVHMATLGKALGGYGAFVAAEDDAIEWLMQRARPYVFSTALPAAVAAAAVAAIDVLEGAESPVATLRARIALFREECRRLGVPVASSRTAIHPLVLGEPARAMQAAEALRERGLLVAAIRPPTVPEGTSRLRISLCAAHTENEVRALAAALAEACAA